MTRLWVALLLPIGFISCMSAHDSVVADTNPAGWDRPVTMTYANTDTVSVREAALLLCYGNDARGGDYVIEARSPSGAGTRDTLKVVLSLDEASNNMLETRLPYRRGTVLKEEGEYRFTIVPPAGTRDVWSAGIDFQKQR